jgi:hypothetical protein
LGDGDNDQGAPLTKEAAAGAGFALAGAAITRVVDVTQERCREKAEAKERRRADLEETRRLAYMALVAGTTARPELVATVANALAHHGLQVPFQEAVIHLAVVVRGELQGESGRWLQAQTARLTTELDAENTRPSYFALKKRLGWVTTSRPSVEGEVDRRHAAVVMLSWVAWP